MAHEKSQSHEDDAPNWTPEAVGIMERLGHALQDGTYDEVFDQLFPPGETSTEG